MTILLESCQIAPAPGGAAELSLPMTFIDIFWLHFHPIRRLLFYEFPCSKAYFLEAFVPKLKESLSLALKHYLPLAGNLVYPSNTEKKPIIRYVAGESVSVSIAESANDFDNLVGNHARDADQFYDFMPQLQLTTDESGDKLLQLLAVQVTLFPGRGVCIGLTNHHSAGDANSIVGFLRSWASISKHGGDEELLITQGESLPLFDRSLIKVRPGLDSIYWNYAKEIPLQPPSFPLPTNRVRATYVLNQSAIKKLKDAVLSRNPDLVHTSSFVVMAAHIWTCLVRSLAAGEEERADDDGDELETFLFAVDSRARLDPPVPGNYFGNCLSYGMERIRHQDLVGNEGFFLAAESIADVIKNRVNDKEKIFAGVENWLTEVGAVTQSNFFAVSGSARVDLYSTDFGWGKVRKLETLSIDGEKYAMSLCKAGASEGGLEVGLSLPKVKMDAFAAAFADGIKGS
ncbi:Anthocyanidin 3-O-glucoside 6''-O-acyltransferase [Sesamum angolense]|uniref:Anthocyanidin 3-O-glucoside 6''-O-acyltransferase n=1 Tax=Sesamum angolense TaxID=2727404 RepID=A0AAE1TBK9_9LAMI|nr:Anthocyanidin 3-O-glucoside 6''-O-acyltransferase [Sesamum angolense]